MTVTHERIDGERRLLAGRVLEASAERVWDLLTDTERWPEWEPSVRAVQSPDRYIRTGTTGRMRTPVRVTVPFELPPLLTGYVPVCQRALDRIEAAVSG